MPRSFVGEARRRVGPKRTRIRPIIERLQAEHPDATIALRFGSDLELLVSVMLSAQTTDVNVNRVTERLFQKYRRPEDYLAVPLEELERDIYATGFFRQKAKAIRGTMKMLIEEYDGRVPRRLEELVRLPGVARKTANVVAAELGEPQGIVVDTHVRRLSQRLGLTRAGRPREDRARPAAARPARVLGDLPAPPDLARPPRLPRPRAPVRGVRAERPLSVVSGLNRHEGVTGRAPTLAACALSTSRSTPTRSPPRLPAVAARVERARSRLRESAIEREARRMLTRETVDRLERLGLLRPADERSPEHRAPPARSRPRGARGAPGLGRGTPGRVASRRARPGHLEAPAAPADDGRGPDAARAQAARRVAIRARLPAAGHCGRPGLSPQPPRRGLRLLPRRPHRGRARRR